MKGKSGPMEEQPVRSQWECDVERHIRAKYPYLEVLTNDRRIIPSRTSPRKMEIDIFMPSIRLGIELNGERYHDHAQYMRDKRDGTTISNEAYKEAYCRSEEIVLLNYWSSQPAQEVLRQIDSAISSRLNDPSLSPYEFKRKIPDWLIITFFIVAIPIWFCSMSILLGILYRSLICGESDYYGYVECLPYAVGSLIPAAIFAYASYDSGRYFQPVSFRIAAALTIFFVIGSGLSLYTRIFEQEPFTGYLSPDRYISASPLSMVSVGAVYVHDGMVYWLDGAADSPDFVDDVERAVLEVGYTGDVEEVSAQAFAKTDDPMADIGLSELTASDLYGYAYFTVDDITYVLAITKEERERYSAEYKRFYRPTSAYIYQLPA